PTGVDVCTLLPAIHKLTSNVRRIGFFLGKRVWDVINMFTVHRVDAVGIPDRIYNGLQLTVHLAIGNSGIGSGRCRRSQRTVARCLVKGRRGNYSSSSSSSSASSARSPLHVADRV